MSNKSITTSPADGRASKTFGVVASDNAIRYTAKEPGVEGNEITITHVDPPGNNAALDVTVTGSDITVSLATDGASAVTSKADAVVDAINADVEANLLVSASSAVGDSNGTGVVAAAAETALTGGQNVKVSSVETTTVITDPEDPKAVQIPAQADATGRDELAVHSEQSPLEQIADF
jgi:hypothetical protein